jgi:cAMP phosphodiesterases class-II
MPVLHGKNETAGDYTSSAFFIRHDPTHKEFLFFGDVSPDSLVLADDAHSGTAAAAAPLTIAVWRVAALKIPDTLSTIFIECSWPSGRPDELLYGHLSPEHLVDELVALAAEVTKARTSAAKRVDRDNSNSNNSNNNGDTTTTTTVTLPRRKRKKLRTDTSSTSTSTTDLSSPPSKPLAGLRVYIIHCKEDEDLERVHERPIARIIRDQVDALVQAKGLGAEVFSAEQGMTISTFFFPVSSSSAIMTRLQRYSSFFYI